MQGIRTWKNSKNQFQVVRLHYSADPEKATEKWKEKAKKGMTADAWRQEMEIDFSIYSGQGVFSRDFTSNHITRLQYMPDRVLHRGWDFGRRRPAVVFTQIDLQGHWCILRSILGCDVSIHQFADEVIYYTNQWFPNVIELKDYGDPAGNQAKDTSEKTTIQILQEKKIYVRTRRSTPLQRIEIISKRLITLIAGVPSLLVNENCRDIIDGFQGGYHYPESQEGKGTKENPADDGYYIHLFDALGYIADHLFGLQGQEREKTRRRVIIAKNWKR